jgi:hypothetical protein
MNCHGFQTVAKAQNAFDLTPRATCQVRCQV